MPEPRYTPGETAHDEGWGEIHSPVVDRFSLVEGGPIYEFQSWLGLAMPDRRHVAIRALLFVGFAWIPLLVFSALHGDAVGGVKIPFLRDFAVNVRMLVCLPLLIAAEAAIDPKVNQAVRHFIESGLVTRRELPAFESAVAKAMQLRDAALPAILLIVLAYAPSLVSESGEVIGTGSSNWHLFALPTGDALTLAGWWFAYVSMPLFRLLLLRWVWLIVTWMIFLASVARLNLAWVPTHPDGTAGLGFLSHTQIFFGVVTFAVSASSAGKFGNMIAYDGWTISDLRYLMIAAVALVFVVVAVPLAVFARRLFQIKERGLFDYGTLGMRYVQQFDEKWNRGWRSGQEALLGTADLQSLADLNNSFAVVDGMRITLLDKETILWLALPPLVPMLILVGVSTPVGDLVQKAVKLMV